MPDDEALRSLNKSVADWEQERDENAIQLLDNALSPDLLFRRANGEIVDKAGFIAALHGPSPFVSRASAVTALDVVGNRAVAVVTVTTTDAEGATATFRNVRVLTESPDGWRIGFWFNDRWDADDAASP
ncbi:nuclear transport factor 2 family protein [Micromonospora sp. DT81.3]|uniref:nuclear transport factor 2 family protein n=1 Tax=Micromonospora sp. DT81.3 TaxID=3416523 RepID=UPI003CE7516D